MAQALNPKPDQIAAEELGLGHPAEIAPRIEQLHDELSELRRAVDVLRELAEPLGEPAQLTVAVLTASVPVKMQDERGITTASVGILNPTGARVLLGIGGERASSQARAISVPPESLMVLPIAAGDLEIGTEDNLEAGDAVVYVFRYRTVQAAFLGSAA
ncbi:MAG: hypothetical protein ACJ75S_08650 [Solirubrobacterales bacterium]